MPDRPFFSLRPDLSLYLASASPRRSAILATLGIPFVVLPAPAAEPAPAKGEDPRQFAMRAARAKAMACDGLDALPHPRLVVAADTIVTIQGRILGKPKDPAAALLMLKQLSGKEHLVITGVCIIANTPERAQAPVIFSESTRVSFHAWPELALRAYATCGEALDKAGGYAIQGRGAFLVKKISGSVTNVIGLPLAALTDRLLRLGLLQPF